MLKRGLRYAHTVWEYAAWRNFVCIKGNVTHPDVSWGRFKNAYELWSLRALKFSTLYKIIIFQCMIKIFCMEVWTFEITQKYYPYIEKSHFNTKLKRPYPTPPPWTHITHPVRRPQKFWNLKISKMNCFMESVYFSVPKYRMLPLFCI